MNRESTITIDDGSVNTSPSRRGWGVLILLLLIQILNLMDRQVIQGLLEPIRHEFNLSDSQLGLISGLAYSGAAVLIGIPAGMLADVFSRKIVLSLALTLWTAFTAFCGVSKGFVSLFLGRMGTGAAESAAPPSSLSIMADTFPKHQQGRVTGLFYAIGGLGSLSALSVGGWVAQHYGWRMAFFAASLPGLVLIPFVILFLKEPLRVGPAVKKAPVRDVLAALAADRPLTYLLAVVPFAAMPTGLIGWIVSLFIRNHGMGLARANVVVSIATAFCGPAAHFLGGFFGDRLNARWPGSQMCFAGVVVILGGAFGTTVALTSSTPVAVAALVCFVFFAMLYLAPSFATVMQLSPPGPRATVLAILTVAGNLTGTGLAPLMAGYLSDVIGGPRSLSPAIAAVMALTIIPGTLFILIARRLAAAQAQRT